jgi:manganese/zinc/iron transport system substrate-binding protein
MNKYFFFISLLIVSCKGDTSIKSEKLNIVTTTTLLTDLVHQLAGDRVNLQGLMGSGVDPHLYKASEGDVSKLFNADLVFYGGLHLEGKLVDVFEKMEQQGIKTVAVSDALDKNDLIDSKNFASNYDPHIWFDASNWKRVAQFVAQILSESDPKNKDFYIENLNNYLIQLDELDAEIENLVGQLPIENRILVTAHDAFSYFGKKYGFEVVGLQGISTASEAGVKDVQELANLIIEKKVPAIFVESSVPRRTIEALQAAVNSKSHQVSIGGSLFSDALGNPGTPEGTYIGMFRYNIKTIVKALKP